MADTATLPSIDEIERAAAFTREPFLLDGEEPSSALIPGSPRRRALDAALAELADGARVPSVAWRRQWSLLLGLDRLLSQDEPTLVDGTVLSAHQVDALSGTLTALLADGQRNGNGNGTVDSEVELASAGIPGEEDLEDDDEPEEPQDWSENGADHQLAEAPEDPNAGKRFWFEHATGAGKTVAALGFVEASRTGGTLILTHRRNLVDQFHGELRDRGYSKRISRALLSGEDAANGLVTVETYQWFVRNAGKISDAYTIVICDEAHTALGEKTSGSIRAWSGPIFIGMTATGALIARHVTDLFPTQTSRFDLAQAARRGVIAPLRSVRIPPGPGVRTIAKVPLRRGEVDTEFDQELLAELLDQLPFNLAVADLYKTRFNGVPGVVYAAGVRHAYNVAQAFRDVGMKAQAVSGETPKRELAQILARYERGDIDVLVNAQLLAEGWNSPRATVCMHLAPTASRRIYQQRVGRVTRRHAGKEAGIVVDFVHPATKHDDPVVTLHSLLDRDVYRGGAIVVGPVRRGRGRRLRVERRVLPVTADENRRIEVFERELWRIAVEHLDYGEQVQWAALAGARVAPTGWRRARAMLHFDTGGELKRTFLITAVDRNKNPALRLRALQEIASGRDAEAFDRALDYVESWPRDDKREGVKVVLQALAEKKIGRRDQANNWIWRCANMTREIHEEYAVQRWPETKRLLGLLVNSSGGAHARNARRLVHAARQQDRRLSAALLAAAIPHTAEAGEVINGARTRMSRKPAALARELLRNFPKGRGKTKRRRSRRRAPGEAVAPEAIGVGIGLEGGDELELELDDGVDLDDDDDDGEEAAPTPAPARSRRRRALAADPERGEDGTPSRRRRVKISDEPEPVVVDAPEESSSRRRGRRRPAPTPAATGPLAEAAAAVEAAVAAAAGETQAPQRRTRAKKAADAKPTTTRRTRAKASETPGRRRNRPRPAPSEAAGTGTVQSPGASAASASQDAAASERTSPRPVDTASPEAAAIEASPQVPTAEPSTPTPSRGRARARKPTTPRRTPPTAAGGDGGAPTEAAVAEPASRSGTSAEPVAREAAAAEPRAREAAPSEPTARDAAPSEPTAREATASEPAARGATASEPTAREAAPSEPTAREAAPTEPAAREAAAAEPAAREAAVAEPVSRRTRATKASAPAKPAARTRAAKPAEAAKPAARTRAKVTSAAAKPARSRAKAKAADPTDAPAPAKAAGADGAKPASRTRAKAKDGAAAKPRSKPSGGAPLEDAAA